MLKRAEPKLKISINPRSKRRQRIFKDQVRLIKRLACYWAPVLGRILGSQLKPLIKDIQTA